MIWFLSLLLHVSCQLVQVLALCPSPFTMDAGLCVFVNPAQSYTWCSANQQCASIGGELINSHSSIKLLVGNNLSSASCGSGCQLWVGLSDFADERGTDRAGWQRVNGRGIFPRDDSLFYPGEPTGPEDCIRRKSNSSLADINCSSLFGFICEQSADAASLKTDALIMAAGKWQLAALNRHINSYNTVYCFADSRANCPLECVSSAMLTGNSRQVLYNSKLRTCRQLLFTDAQVDREIETSADWVKYRLII